jgi:hypothetical protein
MVWSRRLRNDGATILALKRQSSGVVNSYAALVVNRRNAQNRVRVCPMNIPADEDNL